MALNTVHVCSLVIDTSSHTHNLDTVRGCSYGASCCHLRTPGPSRTVLYKVIAEHLETFLASLDDDPDTKGLPAYVQREFYDYLAVRSTKSCCAALRRATGRSGGLSRCAGGACRGVRKR